MYCSFVLTLDDGVTITKLGDNTYSVNGSSTKNWYISLADDYFIGSTFMTNLYSSYFSENPTYKTGDTIKIDYTYLAGTATGGSELSILFRDTTKSVSAVSETKMSRAESGLTVYGESAKIVTLTKDVSFYAMYISTGKLYLYNKSFSGKLELL